MIEPTQEELTADELAEIEDAMAADATEGWYNVAIGLVDMHADLKELEDEIQQSGESSPAVYYFLGMLKNTLASLDSLSDEAILLVDPTFTEE